MSATAQTPYQPLHLSNGQPDLEGLWTNESSTPLQRDAKYGARQVMTPDEVAAEEASNRGVGGGDIIDPSALAHVMRVGGEPRTSLITPTPDGRIPLTLKGSVTPAPRNPTARRPTGLSHDNPESESAFSRCPSAPPTRRTRHVALERNNNYQIVQSKDSVALMTEVSHDVRVIRLDQPHRTDGVRPWFGDPGLATGCRTPGGGDHQLPAPDRRPVRLG